MSWRYPNAFALLREQRFLPFFVTQFLGALNDNVFRNALIVLIALRFAQTDPEITTQLVNISAALFILPFFLFSSWAGQWADKYDRAWLMRCLKWMELLVAGLAGLAFLTEHIIFLIAALFLMGVQSTFFSPIKYSYLPSHLSTDELMGGNGLMKMSTFLAIILGTVVGGLLVGLPDGNLLIAVLLMAVALLGVLSVRHIPSTPAPAPDLILKHNPVTQSAQLLRMAWASRHVFLSILGISWFWFFGTVFLAQMPQYLLIFVGGNEHAIVAIYLIFALSVGLGSLSCNRLSHGLIELGLVPLGAAGLTFFSIHFSIAFSHEAQHVVGFHALIHQSTFQRLMLDTFGIGFFSGLYLVPLYAFVQRESEQTSRSRLIAANNLINAAFMVTASLFTLGMTLSWGWSVPQVLVMTGVLTGVLSLILFTFFPELLMRFVAWLLIHTFYRIDPRNLHHIPKQGAAVLAFNHVSYVDPVVLVGVSKRSIRFVMYFTFARIPLIRHFFRIAKTIPIAGRNENPTLKAQAYESIHATLVRGDLIGIFPEGGITYDGALAPLKPGILKLVQRDPVPVVPVMLIGLWGSIFSRVKGRAFSCWPTQWFCKKVIVVAGPPIPPEELTLERLREAMLALEQEHTLD